MRSFALCSLLLSLMVFSDRLSADLYASKFEGVFEEYGNRRLELVAKFIPENPVIFEAGAHHGHDTLKFLKLWPNAKVICFEANPNSFQIFQHATHRFSNVKGYQLAVCDFNGEANFNVCSGNDGASSLLESSDRLRDYYRGPSITVPCVVLDDWCEENGVDHIDFMWLDLEGVELQVLKSSPKILETVQVIYTETNFQEFRIGMTQFKELKSFLEDSGFRLLSHWYLENSQGDAIFIKTEAYDEN